MPTRKLSLIALTIASAITAHPALATSQAEATGFIEGSNLHLLNKNFLFDRDYKNAAGDKSLRDRRDWVHGIRANFTSGYTKGSVGFGIDAHAVAAFKLDSSRNGGDPGTSRSGLLPMDSKGRARDNYGYVGGNVKARIRKTELKAGDLIPTNPVFGMGSSRMFFGTASGVQLLSNEIDRLQLEAGHFTSIRDGSMNTNRDGKITLTYGGEIDARSADYLGGSYQFTDHLSATLYAGKLEDIWKQYFTKLNYTRPLANDQTLELDFNLYDTSDTGKKLAGKIDTTAWSISSALRTGAHRLMIAYQEIDGDEPFDYIGMDGGNTGGSIWLANSIQYADFNGPNEKSWQLRYDIDMAYFGVPGLSFMARYIKGTGIDDSRHRGNHKAYGWYSPALGNGKGRHWERDLEAKYVVQSGRAKDLSIHARYAVHRQNGFSQDANELRFIVEYPMDIF